MLGTKNHPTYPEDIDPVLRFAYLRRLPAKYEGII